ncbi:hypothetical protein ACQP1W_03035 [Spirillospora sp. CA-255316]
MNARYRPRTISFHGVEAVGGWTVKMYGIAAHTEAPRTALMTATAKIAASALPRQAHGGGRHGVGFAIAHDAADFCFALIDWWSGDNEVHQRVFSSPLDRPEELRPHPGQAIGCVWELQATDFERRAWLRHVLANPDGPDLDAYMADHFEGRI